MGLSMPYIHISDISLPSDLWLMFKLCVCDDDNVGVCKSLAGELTVVFRLVDSNGNDLLILESARSHILSFYEYTHSA